MFSQMKWGELLVKNLVCVSFYNIEDTENKMSQLEQPFLFSFQNTIFDKMKFFQIQHITIIYMSFQMNISCKTIPTDTTSITIPPQTNYYEYYDYHFLGRIFMLAG